MMGTCVREDKAIIITGISFFGGLLCLLWLLFLFLPGTEKSWLAWLIVSLLSVLALCLIFALIVLLVMSKTIISDTFIAKIFFGKKRIIYRENILLIMDIVLGKGDHFYVVYPKGYDKELMKKEISVYLSPIEKTKMITRDERLLVIRKTKKTSKLFRLFNYASTFSVA